MHKLPAEVEAVVEHVLVSFLRMVVLTSVVEQQAAPEVKLVLMA
jgi:hypothetical protein